MADILRLEHENDVLRQRIAELETMVATRDHMLESMQRSMTENTLYIVTVGDMQKRFPDHKSALDWFADHHKPGMVWKFSKYINGQLC